MWMKWVLKHQDLQMFGPKQTNVSNFQVGENLNMKT